MLHPLGDDEHIPFGQMHGSFAVTVSQRDGEVPVQNEEELVGVGVGVPDVLPPSVGDSHVVVVHGGQDSRAVKLRELLDEHVVSGVTLAACAAELGRSRGHLVRSFTQEFGISPHAYLLARRIDLARRRLLLGVPPSRVATETGFHDQAHLTRHFRRHLTTTPARFASRAGSRGGGKHLHR